MAIRRFSRSLFALGITAALVVANYNMAVAGTVDASVRNALLQNLNVGFAVWQNGDSRAISYQLAPTMGWLAAKPNAVHFSLGAGSIVSLAVEHNLAAQQIQNSVRWTSQLNWQNKGGEVSGALALSPGLTISMEKRTDVEKSNEVDNSNKERKYDDKIVNAANMIYAAWGRAREPGTKAERIKRIDQALATLYEAQIMIDTACAEKKVRTQEELDDIGKANELLNIARGMLIQMMYDVLELKS